MAGSIFISLTFRSSSNPEKYLIKSHFVTIPITSSFLFTTGSPPILFSVISSASCRGVASGNIVIRLSVITLLTGISSMGRLRHWGSAWLSRRTISFFVTIPTGLLLLIITSLPILWRSIRFLALATVSSGDTT